MPQLNSTSGAAIEQRNQTAIEIIIESYKEATIGTTSIMIESAMEGAIAHTIGTTGHWTRRVTIESLFEKRNGHTKQHAHTHLGATDGFVRPKMPRGNRWARPAKRSRGKNTRKREHERLHTSYAFA